MNSLRSAKGRRSSTLNGSERRSRRNSAAKTSNSVARRLLVSEKFNVNENKLPVKLMRREMLLDKLSRRGDLNWRRQSKLWPHHQQSDPNLVVILRVQSCRTKSCHQCHSAATSLNQPALFIGPRRTLEDLSIQSYRTQQRHRQSDRFNKTPMSIMPGLHCNETLRPINITIPTRSVGRLARLSMMTMRI
jgi:hypothetical protein